MSLWTGFYKKSIKERQNQLQLIFPDLSSPYEILNEQVANNMIENCIGIAGLPMGLGLHFQVNQKEVLVPMVIEEPSVVAAMSSASKLISQNGGFICKPPSRNIIYAQVQLLDIPDSRLDSSIELIEVNRAHLITRSNEFCQSMVKRGGGVVDMTIRKLPRSVPTKDCSFWLVLHFHIDTCDSMGANCASTVAEGISTHLQTLVDCRIGFRIVSNLCPERVTSSRFEIPVASLSTGTSNGLNVAERIVEAYQWAYDDPFRACTHNKGIMNGIDAVAIASGQDWRAIEASAHCFASGILSEDGRYKPLTNYRIEDRGESKVLVGELELPLLVGVVGGSVTTNPLSKLSLELMGNLSSKELAMILVSVGLAQNFAALRALATDGIQKGHLSLHAKNIALAAGAPLHSVQECVQYMIKSGHINTESATKYLEANHLRLTFDKLYLKSEPKLGPSMLFVEYADGSNDYSINIAFRTLATKPITIVLSKDHKLDLYKDLFGDKSYDWIVKVLTLLDLIKLNVFNNDRGHLVLSTQLKMISILLNLLTRKLYSVYPAPVKTFLKAILGNSMGMVKTNSGTSWNVNAENEDLLKTSPLFQPELVKVLSITAESDELKIGLPLILALWQVFEARARESVASRELQVSLLDEQRYVMRSMLAISNSNDFDGFMALISDRLQITMFLLCDAIRFDHSIVNADTLHLLRELGQKIGLEHALTHDLSPLRLKRDLVKLQDMELSSNGDLSKGVTNCFLVWLTMRKGYSSDELKAIYANDSNWEVIYEQYQPLMVEFWKSYKHSIDTVNDLFDLKGIERASKLYQQYYEVSWLSQSI